MLDVHPPHEKVHGFKDFLLHILTITIGLLIALSLEGCVEWRHHRHLVPRSKSLGAPLGSARLCAPSGLCADPASPVRSGAAGLGTEVVRWSRQRGNHRVGVAAGLALSSRTLQGAFLVHLGARFI